MTRSLPDPAAVQHLVRESYGLAVTDCVLLRSLVNDVYQVTSSTGEHVFKLYGPGRWTPDEVAWEQDLAVHLAREGIAVPRVVRLRDGALRGVAALPEGERPFALTEHVAAAAPVVPHDDRLYTAFGRATAKWHTAAARLRSRNPRPPAETVATPPPGLAGGDAARVRRLAARARGRLTALGPDLTLGVRHGDVTLDNLLLTPRGIVIVDFDSAAPGWVAADLTGVWATEHWNAFRRGYEDHARLTDADLAALPWFGVAERIANLRFHLLVKSRLRGSHGHAEGWVEAELAALRRFEDP